MAPISDLVANNNNNNLNNQYHTQSQAILGNSKNIKNHRHTKMLRLPLNNNCEGGGGGAGGAGSGERYNHLYRDGGKDMEEV